MERDAEGMPLFRPRGAGEAPPIDLATALRLEQEAQHREDPARCDIQQGGKAVSCLQQHSSGAMDSELATITAKGQVTIPKAIREALNLRQGDQLRWDLDDGGVRVRLVSPLDLTYLRGVEAGLQEWASPEDEEAFADL